MNNLFKKVKIIENVLDSLYPNPKNNLYYINEYTLLIAIILTSQCRDKYVNNLTKFLFKKIKSPYDVINKPIYVLKEYIKKIGLYNKKSKYIYNLSIQIIKKHKGLIPKNIKCLENLPGVGHKTASVFLSNISNNNFYVFPVDTHIHRMMYRWELSNCKNILEIEKDAKKIFHKKKWKKLHLQIIFYGREYSPSKKWIIQKDIIYSKFIKYKLIKKNLHL